MTIKAGLGGRTISVRPLTLDDVPAALAIQAGAYPRFLCEAAPAFASRIALPCAYCLAAEHAGALIGYLLAHGWPSEAPPPVNTVLEAQPSEVLFIHDLAVAPDGQGLGLGRRLIDHAFQLAADDGLERAELIAVEGAAPYWTSLGFGQPSTSGALAAKVAGYGPEARWMSRQIGRP